MEEENEMQNTNTSAGEELQDDQQSFLARVRAQLGPVMDMAGITISPVESGWGSYDGKEKVSLTLLRIDLTNRSKFLAYLEALDSESLTPSKIRGLKGVTDSLARQLQSRYDVSNPSDNRMVELLGGDQCNRSKVSAIRSGWIKGAR